MIQSIFAALLPHILTLLIAVPLVGAAWIIMITSNNESSKAPAYAFTILNFLLAVLLATHFDSTTEKFSNQLQFEDSWSFSANSDYAYRLGINLASLYIIVFTSFLMMVFAFGRAKMENFSLRQGMIELLLLEAVTLAIISSSYLLLYNPKITLGAGFVVLVGGMIFISGRRA